MKEDSFNFSLADFLAYLFPGTVALLAIAAMVRLSPFKELIIHMPSNLVTGLLLIGLSYFTGVIVSSLTYNLEPRLLKLFKLPDPLAEVSLGAFQGDIRKAFDEIFGEKEWSGINFYVARSLIQERMPKCAAGADRQNSLRQLRRNSFIPILLLGFSSIYAGIRIIDKSNPESNMRAWGVGVILASVLSSYFILKNLVKVGMYRNRQREAREIYTALLIYHYEYRKKAD